MNGIFLGTRGMLVQAVAEHYRQHQGRLPRRFEVPFTLFAQFKRDLPIHELEMNLNTLDHDSFRWIGIEVRAMGERKNPVMITCDNVVEPL